MSNLQIVGLGMACLDVLVRLKDMPTWEHGARMSAFSFDGGGPVATAMVASSRLGARVGYIGTVGSDPSGDIKLHTLEVAGMDLSQLQVVSDPEGQIVLVFVDEETGERVFCGLMRGFDCQADVSKLDRDYITSADYLHLDGFHYEAALQAAKWMREAGKTVVYDGGKTNGHVPERTAELIRYVDVLICGSGFATALTGVEGIWEAGEAALKCGPRIVVQTEGEDGSYTTTADGQRFHVPAFKIDVIDTTGAGDVFHGAYIVGLLHGWNLESVARFSTAVSALKCTKLGGRAGIPTFDQTLAFLAERGIELTR
jgi:sulfofructose kinase